MNANNKITILTNSQIIFNGFLYILKNIGIQTDWHNLDIANYDFDSNTLYIIDSILLHNDSVTHNIKKNSNKKLICLQTTYINKEILNYFKDFITLSDNSEVIIKKIQNILNQHDDNLESDENILSDREIEVLKLVVSGHQNKEIADLLNISINTVITHRKNISQKTGIKSLSGLTIYAVLKNIISIDNIS